MAAWGLRLATVQGWGALVGGRGAGRSGRLRLGSGRSHAAGHGCFGWSSLCAPGSSGGPRIWFMRLFVGPFPLMMQQGRSCASSSAALRQSHKCGPFSATPRAHACLCTWSWPLDLQSGRRRTCSTLGDIPGLRQIFRPAPRVA